MPAGLQPAPFGHSGTDPRARRYRSRPAPRAGARPEGRGRTALTMVASMPTFDVVSEVDMQEVRNTVDQANREAGNQIRLQGHRIRDRPPETELVLRSSTEDRLQALHQVLEEKLVRRQVSLKALDSGQVEEAAKGRCAGRSPSHAGISAEHAKRINKFIKDLGLKGVSSQTQGDQVRVSGKKRDDLQAVIQALKEQDLGIPLQFQNIARLIAADLG